MKIRLQQVESFIRKRLPDRLKADLVSNKMIKEADLECCTYHHLRRFLHGDDTWTCLARKHSKTGHFTDLLVFRHSFPRIAIELKWNTGQISRKDQQSLQRSLRKLWTNKVYFITTVTGIRTFRKTSKAAWQKNRFFEIVIRLPLTGAELTDWKQRRRRYTSRMGRRRKGKTETSIAG